MLVQDIMTKNVLTVAADLSIATVSTMMQENNIRHFPVMQKTQLIGMVSDRDIGRTGSNLHGDVNSPEDPVSNIMASPVITTSPLEPIEEAAKVLRQYKIGALPVMDAEQLVGIVTGIDFLDALISLTGVHEAASRIDVAFVQPSNIILKLTEAVHRQGFEVLSCLSYPLAGSSTGRCIVARVNTINNRQLASQLKAEGFDVLWPQAKPDL